jgi:hypothetical protein
MDILVSQLAKQLMANPLTRSRVIYKDTGRVNVPALRAELARMQFAAAGALSMEDHTPSRNAKGKGGPKLRQPAPAVTARDHLMRDEKLVTANLQSPPSWWAVSK